MKKLISLLLISLAAVSANATILRTNFSFFPPQVISIFLTNTVGITNLTQGIQNGGLFTNGVAANGIALAQANGLGMTNYYTGANANTMYTQAVQFPSVLVIGGTNLPGVLVVDVNTNLNNALTGVMGIPPFSASNLTWAKTNDAYNLFQDVYFPSDFCPIYGTAGGPNTTNVATTVALEVQLLGNQLAGSGNGSNYVALTFVPLAGDGTEIINTQLPALGAGAFTSLFPFTVNVTNSASATALCTSIIPIPGTYLMGATGLRLLTATPGVAWSTGGSMWLTRCRLILYSNQQ